MGKSRYLKFSEKLWQTKNKTLIGVATLFHHNFLREKISNPDLKTLSQGSYIKGITLNKRETAQVKTCVNFLFASKAFWEKEQGKDAGRKRSA